MILQIKGRGQGCEARSGHRVEAVILAVEVAMDAGPHRLTATEEIRTGVRRRAGCGRLSEQTGG